MAAIIRIDAHRNVVWAPTIDIYYFGGPLPLAGASFAMQVRLYGGAAGGPLATVNAIPFEDLAAPTEDRPDRRCLRLSPTIAQAALAAFPGLNQPNAGDPQTFAYDIVVTYGDGLKEPLAEGPFYLWPGVTV